jgi:hypothetical protein
MFTSMGIASQRFRLTLIEKTIFPALKAVPLCSKMYDRRKEGRKEGRGGQEIAV